MDTAAISLCRDNGIPIAIFDLSTAGNIRRVVLGERVGLDRSAAEGEERPWKRLFKEVETHMKHALDHFHHELSTSAPGALRWRCWRGSPSTTTAARCP